MVLAALAVAVVGTALILVFVAVSSERTTAGTAAAPPPTTVSPSSLTSSTTEATTAPTPTSPPTTAPSTTTSSATTTTTVPDPRSLLVLEPDGLGEVPFGMETSEALARLRELLGDPDEDTGWIPSFSAFGTCPGNEVRVVRWRTLEVFFSDGPTDWGPAGVRHFFSYSNSALVDAPVLDLATREGLRIGSTVGDVRAFYGDDAVIADDPFFPPSFQYDVPGAGFLWGLVSGGEPTDVVQSIAGGFGCGE